MTKHLRLFFAVILLALSSLPSALADEVLISKKIPGSEKAINFSALYVVQWGSYFLTQHREIKKFGSFENWRKNPFHPHFDKDSFDYNLVNHTIVGHYYYLFYRSRGYSKPESFLWTYASSAAFEFTIETATERPSYQDLYQTPVFGTVLGIGMEELSRILLATDSGVGHFFGYLLNPLSLLPPTSHFFGSVVPKKDGAVATLVWEF